MRSFFQTIEESVGYNTNRLEDGRTKERGENCHIDRFMI